MGDPINVFLAQEGIKPEEFLQGKGVKQAIQRFHVENLLAVHFKRVQSKPYMDVRFFSQRGHGPSDQYRVLHSLVDQDQRRRAVGSRPAAAGEPAPGEAALAAGSPPRSRSDSGSYSSGEGTFPLRQVARFPFPVLALDVSVAPKDKVPRLAVSDGDQVHMYRIVDQKFEPEWSKSVRSLGRVFSIQLADLDGDGVLEVIGNRYAPKVGLTRSS